MTSSVQVATVAVDYCPICGAAEREFLFEGYDHLHGLPGRFPVARCVGCETAYLTRRPVDLAAYYPADSYAGYAGMARARHDSLAERQYGLGKWQQLLNRLKPNGGRLLDVGCGTGDFLGVMRAVSGWQVAGVEPNARAARYANDARGLKVLQGELPMPELAAGECDVITLRHVLEHTSDPAAVLTEARRLLRPDGMLVISLPVADSLEAQWFEANWAGYDVPRHSVAFTRAGLIKFAGRLGFQVEERFGVVQGLASLRLSVRFWLMDRFGLGGKVSRFLNVLILAPLFLRMRFFNHPPSVAVFVAMPSLDHPTVRLC